MIFVSNIFSLIDRATCLCSRTYININVFLNRVFRDINSLLLIKRFKKFKERVKSEFEIVIRNIMFK